MSIINETLNRLEMDSPVPAGNLDKTSSRHPAARSMSFTVKALATAMLLVFAGTSLMAWYWNDRLVDSNGLSLTNAGSQKVADGKSDHQLSPVPIGEQAFPKPQSAAQNSETATPTERPAVLSVPRPAEVMSEIGKQPVKEKGSSLQTQSDEKPVAVANVKPVMVKVQTAKSKPSLTVPDKQQQTAPVVPTSDTAQQALSGEKPLTVANVKPVIVKAPTAKSESAPAAPDKQQRAARVAPSGNTAQSSTVDEAVERARLAMSRGQYEQALSALETLSPLPESRADFWLMKGSAHLGLGQIDPAEKAFASAQTLAPRNAQIAVQRAILKQEKGDHASALRILKDAAARHPNVPEVFLNQGYSQQELGAVRDAGRSFRVFLRMTEGRSLYAGQRKAVKEWLAQFSSTSD